MRLDSKIREILMNKYFKKEIKKKHAYKMFVMSLIWVMTGLGPEILDYL